MPFPKPLRFWQRGTLVFAFFQNGDHLCSMGQSPHQLIYNLYNIIALTEIKGYAMIQVWAALKTEN